MTEPLEKQTHLVAGMTANVTHIAVITDQGVFSTKGDSDAALIRVTVQTRRTAAPGDPQPDDMNAFLNQGADTELELYFSSAGLKKSLGGLRQAVQQTERSKGRRPGL